MRKELVAKIEIDHDLIMRNSSKNLWIAFLKRQVKLSKIIALISIKFELELIY